MSTDPYRPYAEAVTEASKLGQKILGTFDGFVSPFTEVWKAKAKAKARMIEAEAESDARLIEEQGKSKAKLKTARVEVEAERILAVGKARADTEAQLEKAHGEGIIARTHQRKIAQEVRRQGNIEAIRDLAVALGNKSDDPVSDETPHDDWLAQFTNSCQDVSDQEMQSLWANVLKGEVETPGSYSRKTLSIVHDLSRDDADLFTKLAAYVWDFGDNVAYPSRRDIMSWMVGRGIVPKMIMHLQSIGLLLPAIQTRILTGGEAKMACHYFDREYGLVAPNIRPAMRANSTPGDESPELLVVGAV